LSRTRRVDGDNGKNRLIARVMLDEAIVARGSDRFVLRIPSPAQTIGGGVVLDALPPGGRRLSREVEMISFAPSASPPNARIASLLAAAGIDGADVSQLSVRTGFSPSVVADALKAEAVVTAGGRAYASHEIDSLTHTIERSIAAGMANHPLVDGVSLQTIRAGIKARAEVMEVALDRLLESRRIEISESLARPFGWVARLSESEEALSDAILHDICNQPAEPPSVAELVARFGGNTVGMLRRLDRTGVLERVSEDRYYSRDAVLAMIDRMRAVLEPGRIYSPAELKEVLGVSRKYLIPFLEYCDRQGITERRPTGRVLHGT